MTSVTAPNGESTQCPTTSRGPALIPTPAIHPSNRTRSIPTSYPRSARRHSGAGELTPISGPAIPRRADPENAQ
ncbi:hypothetical protein L3i22_083330 [Actinoplanes sp. L3-i22]|nr:hypothetical protein L3i22_083330 [Actinoplanes sp. L3-i22]